MLCYSNDVYLGEDINIHELAHSMDLTELREVDSTWESKLNATYRAELEAYDKALFGLVAGVMPTNWKPTCP